MDPSQISETTTGGSPPSCANPCIEELLSLYRSTLLDEVVPFWMRYGVDWRCGGFSNILDDAGNRLGDDKYIWSQGRALWTFSALYNRLEQRQEWLDVAAHIFRYLAAHGRNENDHWMFRLDGQGKVLDDDISIFADAFVLAGLTEFLAATGDARAMELATATFESTRRRIAVPGSYRTAPYETPPGLKNHGVPMVFSLFYHEFGRVAQRPDALALSRAFADEILRDFYTPSCDAVLEFVSIDGSPVDEALGRVCIPGHAIEAMWFLISISEQTGESERIAQCARIIKRHLELAWDDRYGGLRLAIDVDGQQPVCWNKPECKPWWVQIEALVATAYAYLHTREKWCLAWHERIREYAWSHYPLPAGEWTQWLDRRGKRTSTAALPVKDPFHLPRGLLYLIDLFGRLARDRTQTPHL